MRKSLRTVLLAGLLALPIGMTAGAAPTENVLTISMSPVNAGQDNFNPLTTNRTNNVYYLIYDRLVEMGADGIIYPHLLDSWEISDDGLAITFNLREGITFHDGSPLNSTVLKWFLEKLSTGKNKYIVTAFKEIKILNELSVEILLNRPDPNILYNFTSGFTGIPSMQAVEKYGEDFGRKVVIGTGPFKFFSWKTGSEIVVVKNDAYQWGSKLSDNQGPAYIDKVIFREILEDSTRFLEFITGGVDILEEAPILFLDKIKADSDANLISMVSNTNYHMVMNTTNEYLKNIDIRKAIALSINQDDILKAAFYGNGTPAHTYLIDRLPARKVASKFEIRHDLEKAQSIMADLGWVKDDDGILTKDGKILSLTLWSKSNSTERKISVIIQAQLAELGIDVVIEQFDPSSIRDQFKTGQQELVIRAYGWDNADILEWFFNSARLGYPNVAMWNDKKSDDLMDKAMVGSKNSAERIENFREYHEYLLGNFIWAPLVNSVKTHTINKRVSMPQPRFKILVGPPVQDMKLN